MASKFNRASTVLSKTTGNTIAKKPTSKGIDQNELEKKMEAVRARVVLGQQNKKGELKRSMPLEIPGIWAQKLSGNQSTPSQVASAIQGTQMISENTYPDLLPLSNNATTIRSRPSNQVQPAMGNFYRPAAAEFPMRRAMS